MIKFKLSFLRLVITILLVLSITVVEAREVKAKLNWYNITKLSFRVNGTVAGLYVKPGDKINKNQKLINLDQREYTDNVTLTKSLLKSRKSELEESKREYDRAVELFDRTVLSEHELQTAKNNYIEIETRYVTANKNWLKAKRDLEFSSISAPFSAIVVDVAINKNETIVSTYKTTPAIIIAESEKISALFLLSASDIAMLKTDNINVEINGNSYNGKLFFPSLLVVTNLYPVGVLLSIPFGTVRAGMDATVYLN